MKVIIGVFLALSICSFDLIGQWTCNVPDYFQIELKNNAGNVTVEVINLNAYDIYLVKSNVLVNSSSETILIELGQRFYDPLALPRSTVQILRIQPFDKLEFNDIEIEEIDSIDKISVQLNVISKGNQLSKKMQRTLRKCDRNRDCQVCLKLIAEYRDKYPFDFFPILKKNVGSDE